MKKIEEMSGYISVVLGIIGIIGLFWGFGVFVGIIGLVFGLIGYGYDNSKVSLAGVILCFVCIGLLLAACAIYEEPILSIR